jgi:hypothetical protein
MPLNPLETTTADVLAVRIVLGQLIVRIAAGSEDAAAVLEVVREGAQQSAANAKLRGLADEAVEDLRAHLKGSIDRFFDAMRIVEPEPPE